VLNRVLTEASFHKMIGPMTLYIPDAVCLTVYTLLACLLVTGSLINLYIVVISQIMCYSSWFRWCYDL